MGRVTPVNTISLHSRGGVRGIGGVRGGLSSFTSGGSVVVVCVRHSVLGKCKSGPSYKIMMKIKGKC